MYGVFGKVLFFLMGVIYFPIWFFIILVTEVFNSRLKHINIIRICFRGVV